MKSEGLRRAALVGVVALYALSIPWYRESGAAPELWLGLPDWVAVALGCYVGAALLNALAWRNTRIEAADSSDSSKQEPK